MTESQKLYSSLVRRLTLGAISLTGLLLLAGSSSAQDEESSRLWFVHGESEFVCGQLCPQLKHFRVGLRLPIAEYLSLQLAWDPGHVDKPTWQDTYGILGQRLPPRKTWFDSYALRLRASDTVAVSLESWNAATLLPDASGLSFAYALQDSGWNQSALRITIIDPDLPTNSWSFIAGLGEGERFEDRDHKPYLALMLRRQWCEGLEWQGAYSYDFDSLEPDQFYWLNPSERQAASRGFKTQRQALSLILNGQRPTARGLRMALGVQRNLVQGPKKLATLSHIKTEDGPFDLTEILAENWGQQSHLERRTLAFSASYLILAEYLLALHLQQLDVMLGPEGKVNACHGMDSDGHCLELASESSHLRLAEQTYGIGRISEKGWSLYLEQFSVKYDKLYELYHFAPSRERRQRALSLVQLRLRWDW